MTSPLFYIATLPSNDYIIMISVQQQFRCHHVHCIKLIGITDTKAELFKAGLRLPRVSARFEFKFESFKGISVLILFVYKLMIESSKYNRENSPRKCFWTQERETRVKFNPGLSSNRPSSNWAQKYKIIIRNECWERVFVPVAQHSTV